MADADRFRVTSELGTHVGRRENGRLCLGCVFKNLGDVVRSVPAILRIGNVTSKPAERTSATGVRLSRTKCYGIVAAWFLPDSKAFSQCRLNQGRQRVSLLIQLSGKHDFQLLPCKQNELGTDGKTPTQSLYFSEYDEHNFSDR